VCLKRFRFEDALEIEASRADPQELKLGHLWRMPIGPQSPVQRAVGYLNVPVLEMRYRKQKTELLSEKGRIVGFYKHAVIESKHLL